MLGRYQIVRGRRGPSSPLPEGVRLDTRKHTRSPFRPDAGAVEAFLAAAGQPAAFRRFRDRYLRTLEARYRASPEVFEAIAERARRQDVWLGCNCPTRKNPDVRHCHTTLALAFMAERFPELHVQIPRR